MRCKHIITILYHHSLFPFLLFIIFSNTLYILSLFLFVYFYYTATIPRFVKGFQISILRTIISKWTEVSKQGDDYISIICFIYFNGLVFSWWIITIQFVKLCVLCSCSVHRTNLHQNGCIKNENIVLQNIKLGIVGLFLMFT